MESKIKNKFIITKDGSTGLFSHEFDDILHSKTGALTEAEEKFVLPCLYTDYFKGKKQLIVADICFGTGYNSKAFFKAFSNNKIIVDAYEISSDYIILSLFINDGINDLNMKYFILNCLFKSGMKIKEIYDIYNSYSVEDKKLYFDSEFIRFFDFLMSRGYKYVSCDDFISNLHNIYYSYISSNTKYRLKPHDYAKNHLNIISGDARHTFPCSNKIYDIIFLDAFSPQKSPILWTENFINKLKSQINNNSLLITYSKSTPVRSALLNAGFFVGKTLSSNIDIGTVASLNSDFIQFPLDDYDLKLINTTAGITYKDPCFNLSAEDILQNRNSESAVSDKISHTSFIKIYGKRF